MKRIVLTGGPCAGKTTTLNELRCQLGAGVVVVPETATMLLSAGFPAPNFASDAEPQSGTTAQGSSRSRRLRGTKQSHRAKPEWYPKQVEDLSWSSEWQNEFQAAIFSVQKSMENIYTLVAHKKGAPLVICDRGLLDGAAYTQGGLTAFCRIHHVNLAEILARYEAVIHLESLAVGRPELYSKDSNENRMEPLEEAQKLEFAARMVWSDHPNYHLVKSEETMAEKTARVIDMIKTML